MSQLIDGKLIAKTIESQLKRTIKKTGLKPKLAVVLVGDDKPSKVYVRRKAEAAARVGIDFALHLLPAKISKKQLIKKIIQIQKDKKLSGLIIQLPLPEPLYTTEVLNAVKPELDVDCLTDTNIGKLIMKTFSLLPPTPGAVLAILKWLKIKPAGKIIAILGTGALVGKPLSVILANDGATVIACNSRTRNIKEKCLKADIIVTAVGKKRNLLTADMVKRGAIVIDTGIVFENNKMYGDVDFANVQKKASYITPVPGGVGPITVSLLLQNTLTAAKLKSKKNLQN
ncbi:MAG: Bifunctional protein FolD [Candidatus Magasanikbacteria bacterium GW2011_GWA2_37_8]|uniref:Bifunctional protein FolD n=1 Tax=Candidatus Magasanikbacteria bacterium GW2011_GWA2_37_8 TaxID=1619036 RepID=A0A0G0JWU4_9BACT|nr:MAG: Bifunctional protein FolD [Candidatus Magasanikbacteria bacterium GW2011_GWA2_37_8]